MATSPVSVPPPASAESSTEAAAPVVLQRVPPGLACDSIPVEYQSVRFVIDPGADDDVIALTNTGLELATFWADAFTGGNAAEPVIYGPDGRVAIANGDELQIPGDAYASIAGFMVCPSAERLFVFNE
jgi:hypothetical protein